MTLEIRAAEQHEMKEFGRVASIALVGFPAEVFEGVRPEWTLCAFEDGRLATSYAAWPFTMRFNGEGVPVAAVTAVGTLPIYRRRGYLRKTIATHFKLMHERGEQALAVLIASLVAIYQRYGYAVVSTRKSYTVEPRFLEFAEGQPVPGNLREATDEFGLLVELYRRFRAERTGYMHRGRAMWDAGVLSPLPGGGQLATIVYEEAGEPLGYVIYTAEPQPGIRHELVHRITIRDLVWLTPAAYRAIWEYFSPMDVVGNIIWERVPSDDPLPHLLVEPRRLHITSSDGLLARIVDVERALPGRRYSAEGSLTFEVLDDMCPWNRGLWKLDTSGTETSVGSTRNEPEVVMPVSTLAMLMFGQISASEAWRMGRLDVLDHSKLSKWDAVMHTTYRPFCPDIF